MLKELGIKTNGANILFYEATIPNRQNFLWPDNNGHFP